MYLENPAVPFHPRIARTGPDKTRCGGFASRTVCWLWGIVVLLATSDMLVAAVPNDNALSSGSEVTPPGPADWHRYSAWIMAGGSLLVIQTILVSVLLMNCVKRRRAERPLGESEERMKLTASAAGLGIRVHKDAEARRTHQELAHATHVATMGVLAGSLAHELNQPLAAILANAHAAQGFLSRDPINLDEVREILRDIIGDDRRASEVVVRMRALLKKEEARLVVQDLNQIVSEVLGIMRVELMARKTMVITRLTSGLKEVRGDRIQLQQVLLNLLVNACDAMGSVGLPDRQVTIETQNIDGGHVRISVSDRGPGFAPEILARDFEAFRTTKPNGLGLGLPICRAIVNSHGGTLWATNNGERGATVHFTLQLHNAETAPTR
jgi:C4-dicarboxylate-specific signal transduction histidine kinase